MEKLIKLLDEYIPEGWSIEHGGKSVFFEGSYYNDRIIGKDFGFIKWLVENDKIEINKVKSRMLQVFEFRFQEYATYENVLLMLLSIQENPIEWLCEILK